MCCAYTIHQFGGSVTFICYPLPGGIYTNVMKMGTTYFRFILKYSCMALFLWRDSSSVVLGKIGFMVAKVFLINVKVSAVNVGSNLGDSNIFLITGWVFK